MSKDKSKLQNFLNKYEKIIMLVVIVIAMYVMDAGCPLRRNFGIPCPMCGMTRAYISLLRLDFTAAFNYHALFPFALPAVIFICCAPRPYFGSKKREHIMYGVLTVLCGAYYIYRLIFVRNAYFSVDIGNGFVVSLFRTVFYL